MLCDSVGYYDMPREAILPGCSVITCRMRRLYVMPFHAKPFEPQKIKKRVFHGTNAEQPNRGSPSDRVRLHPDSYRDMQAKLIRI